VEPARVHDLLEHPPRAALAFLLDGEIEATPVRARLEHGRQLVGVPDDAARGLPAHAEVVLVIDDGAYWFQLRGITLRGTVTPTAAPTGAPPGLAWFELVPRKTLAWDYGAVREV
jgi:hypothetical protein